ncbi:uncharacterized protein ACA1_275010 [Acanthamoeba castellanii str. Neff]|uniref:Uncharacterized protein n=1 Tax=Acanthamoeba castellanii (strain ATCC 30010 / Neff) TaxID=1257118 RepID=L8GFX4_ACACF|nr:uncharacterized protein ACA1_275010 [Acanthamoeba castellanii str. Neff]ELR11912.1 hypothetical protein ACA1_275010 [Acanthamoeba castellanii str. Neff]
MNTTELGPMEPTTASLGYTCSKISASLTGKKSLVKPALTALHKGEKLTEIQATKIWDVQSEHWYAMLHFQCCYGIS